MCSSSVGIASMYQKAGGVFQKSRGSTVSDTEATKAENHAKMVENVVQELGKGAFELLDVHEKCLLQLFIWAGCGCHKDLNTVQGGYVAMEKWWKEHNIEGPVLLANQDNDAVLEERDYVITQGNEITPVQEQALNHSTRGAIKTARIAGAIFNHKDDKKGHHGFFYDWWRKHVGIPFTFSDYQQDHAIQSTGSGHMPSLKQ